MEDAHEAETRVAVRRRWGWRDLVPRPSRAELYLIALLLGVAAGIPMYAVVPGLSAVWFVQRLASYRLGNVKELGTAARRAHQRVAEVKGRAGDGMECAVARLASWSTRKRFGREDARTAAVTAIVAYVLRELAGLERAATILRK